MNLNSLVGKPCPQCSDGHLEPGPFRTSKGDFVFCPQRCGYLIHGDIDWTILNPPVEKSQQVNEKGGILPSSDRPNQSARTLPNHGSVVSRDLCE